MNFRQILKPLIVLCLTYAFLKIIKHTEDNERLLIIIKPDATSRNLSTTIHDILESSLHISKLHEKYIEKADEEKLLAHYAEHNGKVFFDSLIEYMMSGPVIVSIWEGPKGTIKRVRRIVGGTDSSKVDKNTIRARFAESTTRNSIHASDSIESAEREISIWFSDFL
jgi:nucleoside-diphosphate kinase